MGGQSVAWRQALALQELQKRQGANYDATSTIKAWNSQASKASQLAGPKAQAVRHLLEFTPQDRLAICWALKLQGHSLEPLAIGWCVFKIATPWSWIVVSNSTVTFTVTHVSFKSSPRRTFQGGSGICGGPLG